MSQQETGAEAAFIESWEEWNEIGNLSAIFYDCKLTPALGLDTSKTYDVFIDYELSVVEVNTAEDGVVLSKKFTLTLVD